MATESPLDLAYEGAMELASMSEFLLRVAARLASGAKRQPKRSFQGKLGGGRHQTTLECPMLLVYSR